MHNLVASGRGVPCPTPKGCGTVGQIPDAIVRDIVRDSMGQRDGTGRYTEALHRIPAPGGGGCHAALLGVANLGIWAGIPPEQIASDLATSIPPGSRRVTAREIQDAIAKAVNDSQGARASGRVFVPPITRKPALDGPAYLQALIRRGDGATDADLWELSPYRLDWQPGRQDAVAILRALYRADEIIFCGSMHDTEVRTVKDWLAMIEAGEAVPEHIIPNPVDGQEHKTKSNPEKRSRRCDDAVSDYRFVVVEFDKTSEADQTAFWYSIIIGRLLPVACLIHSAGKSIHGWLRVDLPGVEAWDRIVRNELYGHAGRFTVLGTDRQCANPSRLSRMPGHQREGKGMQRIIYLNPEARP